MQHKSKWIPGILAGDPSLPNQPSGRRVSFLDTGSLCSVFMYLTNIYIKSIQIRSNPKAGQTQAIHYWSKIKSSLIDLSALLLIWTPTLCSKLGEVSSWIVFAGDHSPVLDKWKFWHPGGSCPKQILHVNHVWTPRGKAIWRHLHQSPGQLQTKRGINAEWSHKENAIQFDATSQGLLNPFGLRLDLRSICFGNSFLALCPQTSVITNLSFHAISCK